jgi:excisionase family DNA binding protein
MENKFLQIESITAGELQNLIEEAVKKASPMCKEPSIPKPKYLSRNEVSEILDVSLVTVDKWSNQGYLKKYRIGSRIRFKTDEVHKALDACRSLMYKRGNHDAA